ncbi:MAG: radical SAM protein [Candidatus Omnitrophota bacterium]
MNAKDMNTCINCGKKSILISEFLGVCLECIREKFNKVSEHIKEVHRKTREEFGLPPETPKDSKGISCKICVHECEIPEGGKGYCGLRRNIGGKLIGPTKDKAHLSYYHDNLPTNCVVGWVCPGCTEAGYPDFSHMKGPEIGYKNLAVFYIGCSFNCLFCQNWHYRNQLDEVPSITPGELLGALDDRTSCVCFFGGDPSPQILHSIEFSKKALDEKKDKILRICWETNGTMNPKLLKEIMEIALTSGGCVKFDLKAYDERLNFALCGETNKRTLENFTSAAKYVKKRKTPPVLVASSLLVPGYVDEKEIFDIATFIAKLDPSIPYSLLGFGPAFYMSDLPRTSKKHAQGCLEAARKAGLTNINIGNVYLLGDDY